MYTTDLTDSQWQNIKDNLDFKIWKRKRKYSIRLLINAILYVNKTGIQWRMLPNDFPDWKLVYQVTTPLLGQIYLLLDIQEFSLVSILKYIIQYANKHPQRPNLSFDD